MSEDKEKSLIDKLNEINTWQVGDYDEMCKRIPGNQKLTVSRSDSNEGICSVTSNEKALWIAGRLNLVHSLTAAVNNMLECDVCNQIGHYFECYNPDPETGITHKSRYVKCQCRKDVEELIK